MRHDQGECLRVHPSQIIIGRIWLKVQFLLPFLLWGELGTLLRLRRGGLAAVAGLPCLQRSGAGRRSAVLVGSARRGHWWVLHLVCRIRWWVRMRMHVRRVLPLARRI